LNQKIKSIVIPESGITFEPEHVMESEVSGDFTRSLAHIVAMGPGGSVVLRSTSDGRLYVVTAGVVYEEYIVENGTAADAFTAPNTYEVANGQAVTDFYIETHPAIVSFRNVALVWGAEKIIPVGAVSLDLTHYGVRIRNRNAGNNAVYEITTYR